MKLRLVFSWLIFGTFAVWAAWMGGPDIEIEDRLISALWAGYFFWALYWGVPAVLRLWWRMRYMAFFSVGLWFVALLFLPFCCVVFSLFGGGIYQFLKTWWLHSRAKVQLLNKG